MHRALASVVQTFGYSQCARTLCFQAIFDSITAERADACAVICSGAMRDAISVRYYTGMITGAQSCDSMLILVRFCIPSPEPTLVLYVHIVGLVNERYFM